MWSRISQVADSINVTLVKPRTTTVQRHWANAAHNDQPSDHHRTNVFYSFIDHVVGELETKFSIQHVALITTQNLFAQVNWQAYREDQKLLQQASRFLGEVWFWRRAGKVVDETGDGARVRTRGSNAWLQSARISRRSQGAVHLSNRASGSVSCERSFSVLRRLKLWTRSSMTEDRLSGLARLLIHRGTDFIPTSKEIYDMKSNWRRI